MLLRLRQGILFVKKEKNSIARQSKKTCTRLCVIRRQRVGKKIVTRLKELLPEAGFIAEEGSGTLNDEQYCWLVDPLDGTTNFIHDNAPYCVSIALRSKKNYY